VYRAGNDYIIHNTRYEFQQKHSHIRSLNTAKKVIESLRRRAIPRSFSQYLLTSLIRLADDDQYIRDVQGLVGTRNQKGPRPKYCNQKLAKA
jgi:hypothetical protein